MRPSFSELNHFQFFEHAHGSRAFFIRWNQQSYRALIFKERLAVTLIRDDHSSSAQVGIEFTEAEDHCVPIFRFGEDISRQGLAPHLSPKRNARLLKDFLNGDALVGRFLAILFGHLERLATRGERIEEMR